VKEDYPGRVEPIPEGAATRLTAGKISIFFRIFIGAS
jgi:hypothetical protein